MDPGQALWRLVSKFRYREIDFSKKCLYWSSGNICKEHIGTVHICMQFEYSNRTTEKVSTQGCNTLCALSFDRFYVIYMIYSPSASMCHVLDNRFTGDIIYCLLCLGCEHTHTIWLAKVLFTSRVMCGIC